jgi:hypothetical protein
MRRLGNPVYWLIAAVLILASAVGYLFWRVHQIDRASRPRIQPIEQASR